MITRFTTANVLPPAWDECCQSYFQQRKFLVYADAFNPCSQRYYVLEDDGKFLAGACVYSLKLDLFTYSGFKSPVNMSIIGIPASVSCSGLVGEADSRKTLMEHIFHEEPGIVLALNISPGDPITRGICMRTLPGLEMCCYFMSWENYLDALRSPYRRRIQQITAAFEGVNTIQGPCSEFTGEHYALYLQVWERSKTRLEKLSQAFFTHLPEEFSLTSCRYKGLLVTWNITLHDANRLVFFFGGTNYEFNRRYMSYYNNLAGIIKEGIEEGYHEIELGQTAEIAKMRFGAEVIPKQMIASHRNPLARAGIRMARHMLEYHRLIPVMNVFKINGDRKI